MPPRDPGPVLAVGPRSAERKRGAPKAAVSLPFDVVESKLHVPVLRPGVVSRTALVNRLRVTTDCPVVAVTAPAGYGKTTLLAQWAARDKRAFAWVSIDERDNDPVVLLRHLAAAIDKVEALDPRVLDCAPVSWEVDVGDRGSASGIGARVERASARHRARRCTPAPFARFGRRRLRARRSHAAGLDARPGRPRSTTTPDSSSACRAADWWSSGSTSCRCPDGRRECSSQAPGSTSPTRTSKCSSVAPRGGRRPSISPRSLSGIEAARTERDPRPSPSPAMTATWPITSAPSTSLGSPLSI